MEVMTDLFTYIKDKNIAIDLNSKWFQELWYPLSKKTGSISYYPSFRMDGL